MIILDSTTKSVVAKLSAAPATNQPEFTAHYADVGSSFVEKSEAGTLNGTTEVELVAAPSGTNRRVIKDITIYNADTAEITFILQLKAGGTPRSEYKRTLSPGATFSLERPEDGVTDHALLTSIGTNTHAQLDAHLAASSAHGVTGNIVGTQGAQTLEQKTLETGKINKEAYFSAEVNNGNSGTAKTIDWTQGNKQRLTLTGNCTLTFTPPSGACNLILKLIQDATGSRTVTWPASVKWVQRTAPVLTTTANYIDIISFYFDGTNYFGTGSLNFG